MSQQSPAHVTETAQLRRSLLRRATGRRRPLLRFLGRRIVAGLLTLLVVSVLVFAATDVLPGDAASAVLGKTATPTQVKQMRKLMGLNKPAVERYGEWLGGLRAGVISATPPRGTRPVES